MREAEAGAITTEMPDVHKKFLTFSAKTKKYGANPFSTYSLTFRKGKGKALEGAARPNQPAKMTLYFSFDFSPGASAAHLMAFYTITTVWVNSS